MVTVKLVVNDEKKVIYDYFDGAGNYRGQITVYKSDLSYSFKEKDEFEDSYDTNAYRIIRRFAKDNNYQKEGVLGWC